jgi:Tol biopolymer transport system component
MTSKDGIDRRLTAWLDVEAAPYAPTDLRMRFAEGVGRTRQRPAWATTERWISMETRARLGGVPRVVIILATIGLLAALAAGAYVIGSEGPARNGRIAFVYQDDIYTVAPDGTDRRLLVDGSDTSQSLAWSPDGTRLAYWSLPDPGEWQLRVVDADGTEPIVVASGDDGTGPSGFAIPSWSPDGTKLAFTARTVGGPQAACVGSSDTSSFCSSRVFVAAADGSTGAVQVGDPDMSARTAAWSPDGTTIAFGSGDALKDVGLYLMKADGTDVRRLGEVSGTSWSFMHLAWSPDGKNIAATAGLETPEPHSDVWVFASDGTAEKMPFGYLGGPTELGPAYAPDGALAWGGESAIILLEVGGTSQELAGFFSPAWSPDGQFMVTPEANESGAAMIGHLVIIDRDGTIITTIEDTGDGVSWQRLPG